MSVDRTATMPSNGMSRRHGNNAMARPRYGSNWGSVYGFGTELYLLCLRGYAPVLRNKLAHLEQSSAAIRTADIPVEGRPPRQDAACPIGSTGLVRST